MPTPEKLRIDKWLWAARFFKTRALASHACDLGRVHAGEIAAKPAREVRLGDLLRIRSESGDFTVEVLALSEVRGPAAVAHTLYRETEASQTARLQLEAERKAQFAADLIPAIRPTKRDRRQLNRFRGR
jgi:ribosome-associated heat shock protein Hsp15